MFGSLSIFYVNFREILMKFRKILYEKINEIREIFEI